jgi:hypothetical protein
MKEFRDKEVEKHSSVVIMRWVSSSHDALIGVLEGFNRRGLAFEAGKMFLAGMSVLAAVCMVANRSDRSTSAFSD